jgi:hypothetical protein
MRNRVPSIETAYSFSRAPGEGSQVLIVHMEGAPT